MAGIKIILKSTKQQVIAKLGIDRDDCFICDDPHLFIRALIKIAYNVGKQIAEQKIKAKIKGFSSELPLKIIKSVGQGKEMKISGEFPEYREPKGFQNSILKLIGGLNVVDYTSHMELYGKNIPYKGEVIIKKDTDFHIYSVSDPQSGASIASGNTYHALLFYNKEEQIVAKLFFNSKEDLFLIWNTYYVNMVSIYEQSIVKEYDTSYGTNLYKDIYEKN